MGGGIFTLWFADGKKIKKGKIVSKGKGVGEGIRFRGGLVSGNMLKRKKARKLVSAVRAGRYKGCEDP